MVMYVLIGSKIVVSLIKSHQITMLAWVLGTLGFPIAVKPQSHAVILSIVAHIHNALD